MFDGQVALITGGSSGIGRATALMFAAHGARVAVASRRESESFETIRLLEADGGEGFYVQTDVSKTSEVERMVAQTVERFGRLDFAFNNAGIEGDAFVPFSEYPEDTWDAVIDTNLKGVFLSMKYELPHLTQTQGVIVNMSSVAGLRPGSIGPAYTASKYGVIGLTKVAATQYAKLGVRVNAVAPAVIETPMGERAFALSDPERAARVADRHPLGRVGTPEEVASAVIWLCSSGASFTTGHTLPVDGGFLL
jgi:NAD(P)-dependent dehydrogenase (short-subunit alcohol dehydrogenase family)